jgi:cysteine-rich repeat protein
VLLKRGTCEFCIKAKMAQARGAKGVMIANTDETLTHMTVGTCGQDVTIPSIMIPNSAGNLLQIIYKNEAAEVYFPTCLNGGTIMPGFGLEDCDDGNTASGDGCSSKCIVECGNNVVNEKETCDDGNLQKDDGCSSTCLLEPGFTECSAMGCTSECGDGITVGRREGCDSAVSFAFARYDGDGDGELNLNEAKSVFEAVAITAADVPGRFQEMDENKNGKITLQEWESAGNVHPPLAIRITTFHGIVATHRMESADFGPKFRHAPGTVYSGIIAVANPIEGCGPLEGHYADRIVLLKRGSCEFCLKAKAAQVAGAKAVMVANSDETLIHMTVGTCGADVTIPSIMVPFSVGEELQKNEYKAATVVFPTCASGSPMKPGFGLEECDDGNTESGDGCSATCMSECGNGIVSSMEECDDGNKQNFDGCSSTCTIEPGLYDCTDPAGCHTKCGDGSVIQAGCFLSGECAKMMLMLFVHVISTCAVSLTYLCKSLDLYVCRKHILAEGMIWAHLDLNRNFHLDTQPIEWPFALKALGLSDDHLQGYMMFLDSNRDGSISLQVWY